MRQNQCLSVGILVLTQKWIHKILKRQVGIYDYHRFQFLSSHYTLGYSVIKSRNVTIQKPVTVTVNVYYCIISTSYKDYLCFLHICTVFMQYLLINFMGGKGLAGTHIMFLKRKKFYLIGINDCLLPLCCFLFRENVSVIPSCDLNQNDRFHKKKVRESF